MADFRAGCSNGLMTTPNSFVTNAVVMERAVSWTSAQATLADYTILG